MNKLHEEYRRRRAEGWTAKQAWDAAHTVLAFEAESEAGRTDVMASALDKLAEVHHGQA